MSAPTRNSADEANEAASAGELANFIADRFRRHMRGRARSATNRSVHKGHCYRCSPRVPVSPGGRDDSERCSGPFPECRAKAFTSFSATGSSNGPPVWSFRAWNNPVSIFLSSSDKSSEGIAGIRSRNPAFSCSSFATLSFKAEFSPSGNSYFCSTNFTRSLKTAESGISVRRSAMAPMRLSGVGGFRDALVRGATAIG